MRQTRHVTHMEDRRKAYKILIGKPEGNAPLGRHRCIYIIRMILKWILQKIGREGVDIFHVDLLE
jgi:hypothetical protein